MLRVKTKINFSKLNGIGLFADQFIPKGTTTWQYDPEFDSSFTEEDFKKIPDVVKNQFMTYCYFDHNLQKYVLCSDFQRFINHSNNPNIQSTPEKDIASKDINFGDEMTCDYADYEFDWFERRGHKREDFQNSNELSI